MPQKFTKARYANTPRQSLVKGERLMRFEVNALPVLNKLCGVNMIINCNVMTKGQVYFKTLFKLICNPVSDKTLECFARYYLVIGGGYYSNRRRKKFYCWRHRSSP